MSWEEYGDTAQMCRVGIRNSKAQLELDLARDVTKTRRAFIGTLVKINQQNNHQKKQTEIVLHSPTK